jgi:hypothetical protein
MDHSMVTKGTVFQVQPIYHQTSSGSDTILRLVSGSPDVSKQSGTLFKGTARLEFLGALDS